MKVAEIFIGNNDCKMGEHKSKNTEIHLSYILLNISHKSGGKNPFNHNLSKELT